MAKALAAATAVDNLGERLVPGVSHNRFFRKIIDADVRAGRVTSPRILDLGCGVGHGTQQLSEITGATLMGIDNDASAIAYAESNYPADNVSYVLSPADAYLARGESFDYVVSRHALEHIENGIDLPLGALPALRLMVNVPYCEPAQNDHHEINGIEEGHFRNYPRSELFYEDLQGTTTVATTGNTNSIICISSAAGLPRAGSLVALPLDPWRPNGLEDIGLDAVAQTVLLKEEHAVQLAEAESRYRMQMYEARRDFEVRAEALIIKAAKWEAAYEQLMSRRGIKLALWLAKYIRLPGRSR
jgi:SAM-dependent methyltransferase